MSVERTCPRCNTQTVTLSRSVYNQAIDTSGTSGKYKKSTHSSKIALVCPFCDAYLLGIERSDPCKFLCQDGVERTIDDFDFDAQTFNTFRKHLL